MDADDVALPRRLERSSGAIALPAVRGGRRGRDDRPPRPTARSGRCTACPPAPVEFVGRRSSRRRSSIRPSSSTGRSSSGTGFGTTRRFAESEDYDLWARLLDVADGDNVPAALVLYRRHDGQASTRRAELQLECRRRVALRQIERIAPGLTGQRAELAWRAGGGWRFRRARRGEAADALLELAEAFEARHGGREARRAAALGARLRARARRRRACAPRARGRRARSDAARRRACAAWRGGGRPGPSAPPRTAARAGRRRDPSVSTIVLPEPTPYRTGMLDRFAERPELDLTVVYAARAVQQRAWGDRAAAPCRASSTASACRAPSRVLRHDYPLSLGIFGRCGDATPRSSSSRAGARSHRRQRSRGAGDTASPTCSSSSRTSATPGPAGGGR